MSINFIKNLPNQNLPVPYVVTPNIDAYDITTSKNGADDFRYSFTNTLISGRYYDGYWLGGFCWFKIRFKLRNTNCSKFAVRLNAKVRDGSSASIKITDDIGLRGDYEVNNEASPKTFTCDINPTAKEISLEFGGVNYIERDSSGWSCECEIDNMQFLA